MYFRQPTDKIARVAQDFPIDRAERIEVSIVEVAEGPQNLGGLAIEHFFEGAQGRRLRRTAEIISAISR